MRARDRRKTLNSLKRLCGSHGITVNEVGQGKHQKLLFTDDKTGEAIPLVIARHAEISPGVQRGILHYVTKLAEDGTLSEMVRGFAAVLRIILENLFN